MTVFNTHDPSRHPLITTGLTILLIATVLISSLTTVPSRYFQGPDSAVYTYMAQVIQDGGIPYRDARDSKPPLTYYLTALALGLVDDAMWAGWWLRVVAVIIITLLFGGLLRDLQVRQWMVWPGMLCLALLLTRPVWSDPNTPELYALPFQILALRGGLRVLKTGTHPYYYALLVGLMAGMALLAKQTSGGVMATWIAVLAIATWRDWIAIKWRTVTRMIALTVIGVLLPLISVMVYFAAHGALYDAYDAAIRYHYYYAVEPFSLAAVVRSMHTENNAFGPIYEAMAIFTLVGIFFTRDVPIQVPTQRAITLWLAITVVADLVLVNLAMRGYGHYYLTALPAFFALVLVSLETLIYYPWKLRLLRWLGWASAGYVALLVVLIPNLVYLALIMVASGGNPIRDARSYAIVDYIEKHTEPDDTILVWGHGAIINVMSERRSGSRYFYSHPLALPTYTDETRIRRFLDDLHKNQPPLIIDVTIPYQFGVPPIDEARVTRFFRTGGRRDLPDITPIREFLYTHCHLERRMLSISGTVMLYRCTYD